MWQLDLSDLAAQSVVWTVELNVINANLHLTAVLRYGNIMSRYRVV